MIFFIIGDFYLKINLSDIAYLGNYDSLSQGQFYITMIFTLVSNFPLNFYAIMTIKNIDFKLYMCYIFLGNQMIENLKGSSIFLIGSPKIIYEKRSLGENQESSNLDLNPKFDNMLSETFKYQSIDYVKNGTIYASI